MPVHGRVAKHRSRVRHVTRDRVRADAVFGDQLPDSRVSADTPGYRISADDQLHPGHRRERAVHRDHGATPESTARPGPRHLHSTDRDELCRTRRRAPERAAGQGFHRVRILRPRRRDGIRARTDLVCVYP